MGCVVLLIINVKLLLTIDIIYFLNAYAYLYATIISHK